MKIISSIKLKPSRQTMFEKPMPIPCTQSYKLWTTLMGK